MSELTEFFIPGLLLFLFVYFFCLGKYEPEIDIKKIRRKLSKKAASGDSESMFQIAVRGLWGYDSFRGISDDGKRKQLLDAASVNGNGIQNRKIGDYYRYTFNEKQAERYYRIALEKDMQQATLGDKEAQFRLCEQYAFGLGIEPSEEKAIFWCMQAAENGHAEARRMMRNFWNTGRTLFVSRQMKDKWKENAESRPLSPAVKELKDAAATLEMLEEEAEISEQNGNRYPSSNYKVTYRRGNIFGKICYIAAYALKVAYIFFASLFHLSFTATFIFGYKENGPMNVVNRIFAGLFNSFMELTSSEADSVQNICTDFSYGQWDRFERIILGVITLIGCLMFFFALSVIIYKIAKLILRIAGWIVGMNTVKIKSSPVNGHRTAAKTAKLNKKLIAAKDKYQSLAKKFDLPSDFCNPIMTSVLCDFYSSKPYGSLDEAISDFESGADKNEAPSSPEIQEDDSAMGLYFLIRHHHKTAPEYGGICNKPELNFDPDCLFMQGYKEYVKGKNFNTALSLFDQAIEASPDSAEAGYAAWYAAKIYSSEKIGVGAGDSAHNEECLAKAMKYKDIALKNNCKAAMSDEGSHIRRLWEKEHSSLISFSGNCQQEYKNYLQKQAAEEYGRLDSIGYPLNRSRWDVYDTDCIWAFYQKEFDLYLQYPSFYFFGKKDNELWKFVNTLENKGLYRAERFAEIIKRELKNRVDALNLAAARKAANERNRLAQEAKIEKEMRAYAAELDDRERLWNSLVHNDMSTNMERALRGEVPLREAMNDAARRENKMNNHKDSLL